MFAFACWDPKQRRLLLARDPLGIKPLYLARSSDPDAGWSVAFASELRALLASGLLGTPHLNPEGVATAVWNGFVIGPGTAVKGIDLLWPGRLLELDDAGKEVRQEDFWCIPDHAPRPAMDEDGLAAILEEGIGSPRERVPSRSSSPVGWTHQPWPTWPSAPPGDPSTHSPSRSRSRSSTRGPLRGRSLLPSGRSTTRWC